ncbi:MAG: Ldh family oxidoreductase [Betaproteobacteria bacterium]|jgi:LDH2 family malate/lactate/ureidoglycolate dehydrogenase
MTTPNKMIFESDFLSRPKYNSKILETYGFNLLTQVGLEEEKARVVAKTLIEGDLLGHDTHGLALLAPYMKELESGSMNKSGTYEIINKMPATQVWDGKRLPGPWLIFTAMDELFQLAKTYGVASISIRKSHHIACLAVYLRHAAENGFLMLLASSDAQSASVAPYGGTKAVFTPNPIAMGFPCSSGSVLIDISASITTNGMTGRKANAKEVFDENWLIDANGDLTNDPSVLSQNPPGTILPIGGTTYGHKGYGLALMVEALTGGLAGFGRADPKQGWGATAHITLYDPEAFGSNIDFLRQMDEVAKQCIENPPRSGISSVRLPGHQGLKKREFQLLNGVRLHPTIKSLLESYSNKFQIPFPESFS